MGYGRLFALALSIIFIISCEPGNEPGPRSFRGVVLSSGVPVENASILLKSDLGEYNSLTDAQGRFNIENVNPGEYILTVRSQDQDMNFMQLQKNVSVTSTASQEQTIELPKGVTLLEPSEVTGTSVKLSWNKSHIPDFLEYKLYRHSTSGLDESTGTLVHVATTANDTVFTEDNLTDKQKYFYRVFVRNTFGLYGGSNIREVVTAATDHVQNGNLDAGMTHWELFSPNPCVSLVQDPTSPSGATVFKFQIASSETANISSEIFQTINHTKFIEGATYRLSFSARVKALPGASMFQMYLMKNENYSRVVSVSFNNSASTEWTTYGQNFIAPGASEPFSLFLYLQPLIPYNNEIVEVYVDGISITRQ